MVSVNRGLGIVEASGWGTLCLELYALCNLKSQFVQRLLAGLKGVWWLSVRGWWDSAASENFELDYEVAHIEALYVLHILLRQHRRAPLRSDRGICGRFDTPA